ncbi:MAG: tetratricopeptide repeat protein [Cyanobacteria bacterium]|nr:tetratricopeptide repeat protein [Cyanobacteriota bacterium]
MSTDYYSRASQLYNLGIYEGAERELSRAIAADPLDEYCHILLSSVLYKLRRFEEAIATGKEAVRLNPDNYETYLALGNALHACVRDTEAELAVDEALRLAPDDARVYRLASDIKNKQNLLEEALMHAEKACELDPKNAYSLSYRVNALLGLGRLEEAETIIKSGLNLNPEESAFFINTGRCALLQADYKKAIESCQEALKLRPNDDSSHYAMACALHDAGRDIEAEGYIRECIRIDPHDGGNYGLLADILCALNRHTEAIEVARKGVLTSPEFYFAKSNLASTLLKSDNLKEAEVHAREGIERWPDKTMLHDTLVSILCRTKRQNEAVEHTENLIKDWPDKPASWKLHFRTLLFANRVNEAVETIDEAIRRFPEHTSLHVLAADTLIQKEKFELALKYAEDGRAQEPENIKLIHGQVVSLFELKQLDEADRILDEALLLNRNLDDLYVNKGCVAGKREDVEESIIYFKKAPEFNPHAKQALFNLATTLLFECSDRTEEGLKYAQKYVEVDPSAVKSHRELVATSIAFRNPIFRSLWKLFLGHRGIGRKVWRLMEKQRKSTDQSALKWLVYPVLAIVIFVLLVLYLPLVIFENILLLGDPIGKTLVPTKFLKVSVVFAFGLAVIATVVGLFLSIPTSSQVIIGIACLLLVKAIVDANRGKPTKTVSLALLLIALAIFIATKHR